MELKWVDISYNAKKCELIHAGKDHNETDLPLLKLCDHLLHWANETRIWVA